MRRTGSRVDDRRLDTAAKPALTRSDQVKRAVLPLLFAAAVAHAGPAPLTIDPFTFVPPEGWKVEQAPDKITLTDESQEGDRYCIVAVLGGVAGSGNLPADFTASWRKLLKQPADADVPAIQKARLPTGVDGLTAEGAVKIGEDASYAVLFVTGVGARFAAIAVLTSTQEALDVCRPSVDALFATVTLGSPPPTGKGERVPESGFKDGSPRGLFVGDKGAGLLFLDGGRVTRAVPEGGLDELDWEQHQKKHPSDVGTYSVAGGIQWGDGTTSAGPFKVSADGFELAGKRWVKPPATTVDQIAGTWQAAPGTGDSKVHELAIAADGGFQWTGARELRGKLTLHGPTATLRAEGGKVETHTLLRAPGEPVKTFSLGPYTFARR